VHSKGFATCPARHDHRAVHSLLCIRPPSSHLKCTPPLDSVPRLHILCLQGAWAQESFVCGPTVQHCAPDALSRARVSRVRPSSTKPSSMTGSSRKDASRPTPGTVNETSPAAKDVAAPNPIREFMSGWPLGERKALMVGETAAIEITTLHVCHDTPTNNAWACHECPVLAKPSQTGRGGDPPTSHAHLANAAAPSRRSFRPGPSSATAPKAALTSGLPRLVISGECANWCKPKLCDTVNQSLGA
jgi:hypothetical protein